MDQCLQSSCETLIFLSLLLQYVDWSRYVYYIMGIISIDEWFDATVKAQEAMDYDLAKASDYLKEINCKSVITNKNNRFESVLSWCRMSNKNGPWKGSVVEISYIAAGLQMNIHNCISKYILHICYKHTLTLSAYQHHIFHFYFYKDTHKRWLETSRSSLVPCLSCNTAGNDVSSVWNANSRCITSGL